MDRDSRWVGIVTGTWIMGLATAAWAVEIKVEVERNLAPQQVQAVREAVDGLGEVQKLEVERGQLEARINVATLSTAELQNLLEVLRDTGAPFEIKLEATNLTPAEIAALQDQVAGLPAEVKVEVEDGVQEIEIEVEHAERHGHGGERHVERHEHGDRERPEIERSEGPEEFELAERPEEVERPDREGRPEREEIERPDVDHDEFDD